MNRGNGRSVIFLKDGDYEAFKNILAERACSVFRTQRTSTKLVKHAEDWRWGSLYRWVQSSEPLPRLLSPLSLDRSVNWIRRVNEPLDDKELDGIRWSIRRGSPFGQSNWVESIARRLDLESTLRPRGRPKKRPIPTDLP